GPSRKSSSFCPPSPSTMRISRRASASSAKPSRPPSRVSWKQNAPASVSPSPLEVLDDRSHPQRHDRHRSRYPCPHLDESTPPAQAGRPQLLHARHHPP